MRLSPRMRFTRIACTLTIGYLAAQHGLTTPLHAQVPPKVNLVGVFNEYNPNPETNTMYNDCWGYTAPDGREYAFLGVVTGTSIIDITDAPTLNEIVFIPNHRGQSSSWKDIKTYRHYAYVVTEGSLSGLQVIDLSNLPTSATLVKTDTSVIRASHNLYIDTARALLYSEGDAAAPVRVWSLADPANPAHVSSFGPASQQVHDVYARGNKAYLSEGSSGTYSIYDVSNPASPQLIKRWSSPTGGYAHNAWLSDDESLLMTTEETPTVTVKLWNISNVESIQLLGQYLASNQLAHNTHIRGSYAYISHYKTGLRIVDISDPNAPVEAGSYNTYTGTFPGVYHGAWGAYPFFPSGRILISDMEHGLFVVTYDNLTPTGVPDIPAVPGSISLEQNYPNPFNPSTSIRFFLSTPTDATVAVHDLLGREIATLRKGPHASGWHGTTWEATTQPSGVYVLVLRTSSGQLSRRMVLTR